MGALRHVFNSGIPLTLKLQIYKSAICSLLTYYGCEAWTLDEKTLASINGANARCLSWFTGKDAHTEASVRTRTYDLVHAIRVRRFRWLGHILRLHGDRLVKLAVAQQYKQGIAGNMFYDVPSHLSFQQVQEAASDRRLWKRLEKLIRPHSSDAAGTEKKLQMRKMTLLLPSPLPSSPRFLREAGAITRAIARDHHVTVTTTPPAAQLTTSPRRQDVQKKYRARDTHECFFRPTAKPKKTLPQAKRATVQTRPLTDKQRAAEAHAHYIIHHGNNQDAACFLETNVRARHITFATTNKLKQMCPVLTTTAQQPAHLDRSEDGAKRMVPAPTMPEAPVPPPAPTREPNRDARKIPQLPTWDEAEAAVFSSSSESEIMNTPPTPTASHAALPPIPTWEEAAAAVFSSSESDSSSNSVNPSMLVPTAPEMPPTPAQTPSSPPWAEAADFDSSVYSCNDETSPPVSPLPVPKTPEPPQPRINRRRTRKMTATARSNTKALNISMSATNAPQTTEHSACTTCKTRNQYRPQPSKRPKIVKVAQSRIPGAGLGLFLMEDAHKGEFVARYSGQAITRAENETRTSHYRIKISGNLFLDAEKPHHFEGRLINDGRRAGKGVNVRFSAGYRLNTCSTTDFKWIRIFATRNIKAGEELYLDYGSEFWVDSANKNNAPTPTPTL